MSLSAAEILAFHKIQDGRRPPYCICWEPWDRPRRLIRGANPRAKIWFSSYKDLNFLSFRLENPIHSPKISVFEGVYPQNLGGHRSDPQKAHTCVISRLLSCRA